MLPGHSNHYPAGMAFLVTVVVGVLFGAGDQYLGSLRPMVAFGPWTVSVSQMSAPWLLLPFAVGCTVGRSRKAALLGLVASLSALAGYFAMTISPVEGVAIGRIPAAAGALLGSNLLWIVGGLVTGPWLALLGQRWAVRRAWAGAALVAGAFLFEPLARAIGGHLWAPAGWSWPALFGPAWVWAAEAAVGAGLAAVFVSRGVIAVRAAPPGERRA